MEALRNMTGSSRGAIMNVVYVIAFLVALYYLYKFLIEGSDLEVSLLEVESDANKQQALPLPTNKPDVRVKTGGEYTISWWMYISNWDYRAGLAKSVLQIIDQNDPGNYLFNSILYPNENRMMIRVRTDTVNRGPNPATDYTRVANFDNLMAGTAESLASMSQNVADMPICDMMDVDLQRWINVTVTVNGRILDVYYDGKLHRSCVLPDIPVAPSSGAQYVYIGNKGGYGGKISGVQFMAYPLTPDRIYAIYQAGPAGAAGFLGYVAEKLGLRFTYSGRGGQQKTLGS